MIVEQFQSGFFFESEFKFLTTSVILRTIEIPVMMHVKSQKKPIIF